MRHIRTVRELGPKVIPIHDGPHFRPDARRAQRQLTMMGGNAQAYVAQDGVGGLQILVSECDLHIPPSR
ncbi:MAG: hypothetical protein U0Q18_19205 [Bryobacteraceae bacterium]